MVFGGLFGPSLSSLGPLWVSFGSLLVSFGVPGAPQNDLKVNLGTPWSAQVSPDIAKDLKNDAQDLPEI